MMHPFVGFAYLLEKPLEQHRIAQVHRQHAIDEARRRLSALARAVKHGALARLRQRDD
jgi:hypothetical protein